MTSRVHRRPTRCQPSGKRSLWTVLLLGASLYGCATEPIANPAFNITRDQAQARLDDLAAEPRPAARPLVLLTGYGDPGISNAILAPQLAATLQDPTLVRVEFHDVGSFPEARTKLIDTVDQALGYREHPIDTVEVDVVAMSMGGLVARYAAEPVIGRRRLAIARLFTIATPHRGADWAQLPTTNRIQKDMRIGSRFITRLNEDRPDYELIAYAKLRDSIVGAGNTAPPGMNPYWLAADRPAWQHAEALRDPRIVADIALRLRGEEPITGPRPTPVPEHNPAPQAGPVKAQASFTAPTGDRAATGQ